MQFKHNKYISKSIISGFLTILILIILFFVSNYYNKQNNILYNNIKSIENKLHLLEKETINILNNTVERLNKNPDTNPFDNTYILQSLCDNGISLYAFYNDSLVYWTDNHVPLPEYSDFITNDTSLISQLKNGFYEIRSSKQPPWTITAYILIKSNYKYQNEYLTNSFNNKLNIPENTELSLSKNNINIYSYDNKFLFSLNKTGKFSYSSKISILIFVLYILFYCVLLYFIYCILNIFSKIKTNNNIFLIIYTVLLIFTRFVFYKYKILSPLYDTIIFSPQLYASSIFLPSLGDLFLTILTVIFIVLAFYNKLNITADNKKIQIIITIFSLIFYLALFGFFHYIIKSLVIDSSITLNPDNIFNLDIFSLLAYFIIIILIFLLTVAILKIYNLIFYNNEYFKQNFIVFISLVALFFIINLFTYLIDIKFITAFTVIFLTIIISYRLLNNDKITVKIFIAFALFSAYSTIILSQNFKIKEQEKRKLLALKLAKEKDPVAEYLFQQISTNILHDEEINELLHKTSYDENIISNKILEKYFDKYWDNFNIQLTFCNKYDKLNVQPFAVNVNCQDFFNSLVKDSIYSTTDKNLFYVDYGNSYKGYLGIINFNNKKNDINNSITLYIEFKPKFILKGLGLPELFVYQKTGFNTELADYSYAFYKSGTLIESYGKFIYPTC